MQNAGVFGWAGRGGQSWAPRAGARLRGRLPDHKGAGKQPGSWSLRRNLRQSVRPRWAPLGVEGRERATHAPEAALNMLSVEENELRTWGTRQGQTLCSQQSTDQHTPEEASGGQGRATWKKGRDRAWGSQDQRGLFSQALREVIGDWAESSPALRRACGRTGAAWSCRSSPPDLPS